MSVGDAEVKASRSGHAAKGLVVLERTLSTLYGNFKGVPCTSGYDERAHDETSICDTLAFSSRPFISVFGVSCFSVLKT